jgi:hypothetical protein
MAFIDTEKEERLTKDTFAGIEMILQEMRQQSFFNRQDKVRELYKSLKSTIAIINVYMESKSDKFNEVSYDLLGEDLDYFQKQADILMEGIDERVTA